MKLKLDENGNAVIQNNMPVYVHDDGQEIPFDAAGAMSKITSLNGEAKSHRERAEQAETKLKSFEGIEDPKSALEALKVVKNLDDKTMVDAGEVERIKQEIIKGFEDQYEPISQENEQLKGQLKDHIIGGAFSQSKYISESCCVPPDMMRATFGNHFKVSDGKLVAVDSNGNEMLSRKNPGGSPDFDEAMSLIVDSYQFKDSILKGSGASGGGVNQGGDSGAKSNQITREQFGNMSHEEKSTFFSEGGKLLSS